MRSIQSVTPPSSGDHLDNPGRPRDHTCPVAEHVQLAVRIASEAEDGDAGMLKQIADSMGHIG
jgi:hypothetical protein